MLDPSLLGTAEARRRVIAWWSPGARLRELPDGRWLLHLAEPVRVRAERAPGLLVSDLGSGLAAGGAAPEAHGTFAECRHGERRSLPIADLTEINPADWLSLLRLVEIEPLDRR